MTTTTTTRPEDQPREADGRFAPVYRLEPQDGVVEVRMGAGTISTLGYQPDAETAIAKVMEATIPEDLLALTAGALTEASTEKIRLEALAMAEPFWDKIDAEALVRFPMDRKDSRAKERQSWILEERVRYLDHYKTIVAEQGTVRRLSRYEVPSYVRAAAIDALAFGLSPEERAKARQHRFQLSTGPLTVKAIGEEFGWESADKATGRYHDRLAAAPLTSADIQDLKQALVEAGNRQALAIAEDVTRAANHIAGTR